MSKIIVAGDSIAYGKWDSKGGWVARLRNYIDENYNIGKGGNFQVYNLGIPGEIVPRLSERFEKELEMRLPENEKTNKKNLVIFAVGINDSCPNNWLGLKQTPENEFKFSFENMINSARKYNCKMVVIGLTPVNSEKSKGLLFSDNEVKKYDRYLSEICRSNQIPKLELFDDLYSINFSNLLVDAVHPNDKGHEIMFEKIKEYLTSQKLFEYLIVE
ncbi:MAG TPA: GDSL-type esterase/lipase family protein [Patescibacteria group bacterium]